MEFPGERMSAHPASIYLLVAQANGFSSGEMAGFGKLEETVTVKRILDAIYVSSASGREVRLDAAAAGAAP